jgi:hypothetical protein
VPPGKSALEAGGGPSADNGRRFDELPVLAEALEDAGCDDGRFPEHRREPR